MFFSMGGMYGTVHFYPEPFLFSTKILNKRKNKNIGHVPSKLPIRFYRPQAMENQTETHRAKQAK